MNKKVAIALVIFGCSSLFGSLDYFGNGFYGYGFLFFFLGLLLLFIGLKFSGAKFRTSTSEDTDSSNNPSLQTPKPHSASYKYTLTQRETNAMNAFLSPLSNTPVYEITATGDYKKPLLVKNLVAMPHTNISKSTSSDKYFRFISIDVETTGLNATSDIIEVSAIKWIDQEPVEKFSTLCKTDTPIPVDAARINHITDEMVADAPYFYNIVPDLQDFISDFPLVGHNIDFDLKFLQRYGLNLSSDKRLFFDTLDLSRKCIKKDNGKNYSDYYDRVSDYKLDTVAKFFNIKCPVMHRSICDSYVTGLVFLKLIALITK